MTFGFSRDDAGKFLSYYYDKVYEFRSLRLHLDQNGVGKLVAMAAKLGRRPRPDIHLGILRRARRQIPPPVSSATRLA